MSTHLLALRDIMREVSSLHQSPPRVRFILQEDSLLRNVDVGSTHNKNVVALERPRNSDVLLFGLQKELSLVHLKTGEKAQALLSLGPTTFNATVVRTGKNQFEVCMDRHTHLPDNTSTVAAPARQQTYRGTWI